MTAPADPPRLVPTVGDYFGDVLPSPWADVDGLGVAHFEPSTQQHGRRSSPAQRYFRQLVGRVDVLARAAGVVGDGDVAVLLPGSTKAGRPWFLLVGRGELVADAQGAGALAPRRVPGFSGRPSVVADAGRWCDVFGVPAGIGATPSDAARWLEGAVTMLSLVVRVVGAPGSGFGPLPSVLPWGTSLRIAAAELVRLADERTDGAELVDAGGADPG